LIYLARSLRWKIFMHYSYVVFTFLLHHRKGILTEMLVGRMVFGWCYYIFFAWPSTSQLAFQDNLYLQVDFHAVCKSLLHCC